MRKTFLNFVAFSICAISKQVSCNAYNFDESSVTTLSLISDYGYPAEVHEVTTADDYIVTLYRIPYSPKNVSSETPSKRSVVFLMHGFMQSSSDWVLGGYPRGLAFFLSDAGYDVWLGNARGSRYSKGHVKLNYKKSKYWDFSWHEIGIYDLPANFDYVLKNTSSTQLQYIGHSQGTTSFLVAASILPNFNEMVSSAFLLAPVAFMSHAISPSMAVAGALYGHPHPSLFSEFSEYNVQPNSAFFEAVSNAFCTNSSSVKAVCLWAALTFFGANSEYTNGSAIAMYYRTAPAASSSKQLIHYGQLYNSKKFRQFDYGFIENVLFYGHLTPPDYKIGDIDTPIYAYYSENDALAAWKDVEHLLNLMQPTTLKNAYKMPFHSWNHLDFLLANDIDKHLYSILLEDMKRALENP